MANDVKRYEWLARAVTAALVKSAFLIRFGEDTEAEIASRIGQILGRHNIIPEVLLVAGDENAFFTNHPMPREDYVVQNYALMVLCARWRGYIVNLTRIVSRGNVSDKLKKDLEICAMAAGTAQYLTKPGLPMSNVYDQMRRVFADAGYPNAWKSVHWGGPTGLGIRDFCVSQYTRSNVLFQEEQPFTWNPILPGVKVEETIISAPDLVTREPARTLTVDPYGWWPMGTVTLQDPAAEGLQSSYPMILER
jgi:Xaa-Pro aminopeptidase